MGKKEIVSVSSSTAEYEEEEEIYEVEKVLNHKIDRKGHRWFLLKWKGYPADANSWEKEEDLNCKELLDEYLEKAERIEKENEPEGRLIERPIDIKSCHFSQDDNEFFYSVQYKSGKEKTMTSGDLRKLSPELQIHFLEYLIDFDSK